MSFENVRALKKELTDLRTAALYSKGRAEAAEKDLAECRAALANAEKKACRHVHLSSGKEDPDTVDLRAELAAALARERVMREALRYCEKLLADQIDKAGFATGRVALFARCISGVRAALSQPAKTGEQK